MQSGFFRILKRYLLACNWVSFRTCSSMRYIVIGYLLRCDWASFTMYLAIFYNAVYSVPYFVNIIFCVVIIIQGTEKKYSRC